jgi:Extracellular link domain
MNATPKPSTNGMNQNSSFITAANNTIKNAANAVNNAVNKNTNGVFSDILEPVNDSIQSSFNNDTSPIISIPVILMLGALILIFIIIVMFRDQITMAMDIAWRKMKHWYYGENPPAPSAPSAPSMEEPVKKHHPRQSSGERVSSVETILPSRKEVFNVAQDKYTYSDAEPLCKAFGAELATYDQVKEAYNKGADWCNYGWIKGQAAVFPTQQATYDKAQMGPEDQRGACGIPGVNGGYFDNPELRFGVNCYGSKPNTNDTNDRHKMKNKNLTPGALEYDKKVQDYKHDLNQIPINAFKEGAWRS